MSRRALITGSARGLGRHLAVALGSDGFTIVVHYRSSREEAEETARLVAEAGGESELVHADLSNPESVAAMASELEASGGLDVLVNNVGGFINRSSHRGASSSSDRIARA